jgi:hypothetical protein
VKKETMPMNRTSILMTAVLAAVVHAQAPQHVVVPASAATADANSFEWVAGASSPLRQQNLIAASHLIALVGRTLTALEFRRTAVDEVYDGASLSLHVTMSHAPHGPLEAHNDFASNVGANATTVFQGTLTLPTSPAVPAGPGAPVAWSANNVLRIPFTTPFVYNGGPLCVDVVGTPVAGQSTSWWMADAVFEPIAGAVSDLGGGCGAYGGAQKRWSYASARSLLPGAYAHFEAYGPPGSLGLCVFGHRAPQPIPLALLGFPSPAGCDLMLGVIDMLVPAPFVPDANPGLLHRGGLASVELRVPNSAAVFGATLTTQWFEWTQQATSNALEWTVASAAPSLGMALLEGHPQETTGTLSVHLAHVLRFEAQ